MKSESEEQSKPLTVTGGIPGGTPQGAELMMYEWPGRSCGGGFGGEGPGAG